MKFPTYSIWCFSIAFTPILTMPLYSQEPKSELTDTYFSNMMHYGADNEEITDSEINISGPRTDWSLNAQSDFKRSPTWYNYNHRLIPSEEPYISRLMKMSAESQSKQAYQSGRMPDEFGEMNSHSGYPESKELPSFGTSFQLEPGNDYSWNSKLNIRQSGEGAQTYDFPIDGGVGVQSAPMQYSYRVAVQPDHWDQLGHSRSAGVHSASLI